MTGRSLPVAPTSTGGALLTLAAGVGALVAVAPLLMAGVLVVAAVGVWVWNRPVVAAYLAIGVTPLVAGIDRGTLFPLLRPNEALAFFLAAVLVSRALLHMRAGEPFRITMHPIEQAFIAMAVASSIIPIAWMLIRGRDLTGDDISYALVLWKFLGVYALVRLTVKTQDEIHRCLRISILAAVVVATIGILQVAGVIGLTTWPMHLYVPEGHLAELAGGPRASSTLTLPAATADLLVFNLALALGMFFRKGRDHGWYAVAAVVFVVGVFAAGEFSSAIGLLIGVVTAAFALRVPRMLLAMPLVLAFGAMAMWPVVSERLQGFASVHGLPASWIGRLHNLETYFWPELWSGPNILLGVRPAARVPLEGEITGFVWIESGYTWLLWGGGIPLLLAFVYFTAVVLRTAAIQLRSGPGYTPVAALGVFVALVVIVGLMVFDPHLTYRGSADCFYALLALVVAGQSATGPSGPESKDFGTADEPAGDRMGRDSYADAV